MCAGDWFTCKIVQRSCESFRNAAGVDEDERGGALANDLQQARMNRLPDGGALRALRCRAARNLFNLAKLGHVFDGDFDLQVEELSSSGVDDGDGTIDRASGIGWCGRILCYFHQNFGDFTFDIGDEAFVWAGLDGVCFGRCSAEESGYFFERALSSREADALDGATGEGFKALNGERHVGATLARDEGVNFVDDDGLDGAQGLTRLQR